MNDIVNKQNEPASIAKLKAQRKLYRQAKCIAGFSLGCLILPVVLGNLVKFWLVGDEKYMHCLVIYSAIAAILKLLANKWEKRKKSKAAIIQQSFDSYIFGIPWKKYWGQKPTPNEINSIAHNETDKDLKDWYEPLIYKANQNQGILLCQLENIHYDNQLKNSYYHFISILYWLFTITMILFGALYFKNTIIGFILYTIIPLTPLFVWYLSIKINRDSENEYKQKLDELSAEAWEKVLNSHEVSQFELITIQDTLLQYRKISKAVPDCYYKFVRNRLEGIAYQSTKDRLVELSLIKSEDI